VVRIGSRRQFGRPIGENQALSFPLARHFAEGEAVRLLLHKAAWLDDQQADATLAATQALAYAAELVLDATVWAIHVHGAAGLTRQEPVHQYYQVAASEAVRWGTPRALWREAARLWQGPTGAAPRSAAT
jgi:alkylation response protein AidB-like acyl-CoA dehydrogenase